MRTVVKTLLLVVVAFFASNAVARELPPPPGEPKPFELAEPESFTLDNGLKVTFVDYGFVPKVRITAVIRTGNKNEGGKTWVADLTGELMREGTANRSAVDIVNAAAEMGGAVNVGVGLDQSNVSMDVLSDHAGEAIALIADILQNPLLPESELVRIKQNYLRNLSVAKTTPRSVAGEAFAKLLYGDHPYGTTFPTEEQLEGYTIEDIKAYFDENFGAQRTHIYVAGQFDHKAVEKAIREAFGEWKQGPAPLDMPASPQSSLRVKLIDRPGSEQSTIYLGLPTLHITDPDSVKMQVMHTLLGGAFSSRIVKNIREDKGYTYSPRASISRHQGTSYWVQSADVTTDVTGPALHEIFYEIKNLQDSVPPAAEVDKIQNYLAGIFVLQNASSGGIVGQLATLELQGLDISYLNTFVDRVFAVEDVDVSAIAKSQLPIDQMTLVVVGDLAKIEDQIRALPELQGAEYLE